jgi:hypothetical protein
VNSIDEKHSELLSHFHEIETVEIPALKKEKKRLNKMLSHIHENQIDKYIPIQDRIDEITMKIKELKKLKTNYLLENSKYVFQYFEDKKKISVGSNSQNINKLNQFFKIKDPETSSSAVEDSGSTSTFTSTIENTSSSIESNKNKYHCYWKNVRNEISNIQDFVIPSDICESCRQGEMIPQEDEGILICNNTNCCKFITYIVDNSKPPNKEPPNEVSYTAYIRLNHFKEILSQFQAKETTQIPPEIIEKIRNRIKKERITDLREITYDKMREILKKLQLNKYFEHIQYINSLLGIKPPLMSEELHETLCVLFIEIQGPWAIHCPPNRTNFFNYAYALYQLCTLLGQTQYLPYIPLLKDRTKQLEQDMIWKKVCETLNWEFNPTI